MSETNHSPEPWVIRLIDEWRDGEPVGPDVRTFGRWAGQRIVEGIYSAAPGMPAASGNFGDAEPIIETDSGVYGPSEPDARRIVACVNACAGIPTEALEAGALGKALDALAWHGHRGLPCPYASTAGPCRNCEADRALRALGRLP